MSEERRGGEQYEVNRCILPSPVSGFIIRILITLSILFLVPTRYEIMNLRQVDPGVYDYINVGSWHEGLLSIDDDMIRMNRSEMVRSVCSEPCSKGDIKVRRTGSAAWTLKRENKLRWIKKMNGVALFKKNTNE